MSPVGQVDGPTEALIDTWRNHAGSINHRKQSSIASSEGKSDKKCPVIRATTPSRYLKRTGLMPNGPHLQVITTYKTSIISSSSSSSPRSPSSAATNWAITSTSGAFHLDTPCSSGLTKSNLAELMEQLNIPGLDEFYRLRPQSNFAKSDRDLTFLRWIRQPFRFGLRMNSVRTTVRHPQIGTLRPKSQLQTSLSASE
ncbi:hypothetical protein KEM48_010991 [Puccinia striiformis f. sp. tritici PST-130]|nr:hypothetical protein KEM48_010991 [Puccinia striiformis f. sp. tritici PST-130]